MATPTSAPSTPQTATAHDGDHGDAGGALDEDEDGEPPNVGGRRTAPPVVVTRAPRRRGAALLALLALVALVALVAPSGEARARRRGALRAGAAVPPPGALLGGGCSPACCAAVADGPAEAISRRRAAEVAVVDPSGAPCLAAAGGVGLPAAVQYAIIAVLVLFSALFSGLTLGLMSLDPSGLEIVMANADDPRLARAAAAIYPVRLNGNLLLCTLLLGNVGVNSLLSILLADLTSGTMGFLVSTAVIVVFGEIIPQAICSRFALRIGERTVPLVRLITVLLYPLCKPMSMALNKALGHEVGTAYSTSEMAKLIEMHVARGDLAGDAGAVMTGALRYRHVSVREVMTPLANTFVLGADDVLGFDTVAKIFKTGYSRIPVYEGSPGNVVGLLFVKDLIFLDPEDDIPVRNFVQIFGRGLHVVWPDDKLDAVLKLLKRGRSHMALVRDVNDGGGERDPYYEVRGIITLEDIIELILGDEIVDETDGLVDVNDPATVVARGAEGEYLAGALEEGELPEGAETQGPGAAPLVVGGSHVAVDWEARLRLLDERLVDERLGPDEVRAVAAHLRTNHAAAVALVSDRRLRELLAAVPVVELPPAAPRADGGGTDGGCDGPADPAALLYARGVPAETCTVVLAGRIAVAAGADRFRSDVTNWGVLASRVLTDPGYVPDFAAWAVPGPGGGGCRCVRLDRTAYGAAVDRTADDRREGGKAAAAEAAAAPGPAAAAAERAAARRGSGAKPPAAAAPLPPQTPGDAAPAAPAYLKTEDQRKKHTRRGQLLEAFKRSGMQAPKKGGEPPGPGTAAGDAKNPAKEM